MAELSDLYAALQAADAANDKDGAQQLADYIRTQSAAPAAAPTNADQGPVDMDAPLKNNPLANQSFGQNLALGAGELYSNVGTGAQELYARATGNQTKLKQLQSRVASDSALTQPIDTSWGGNIGKIGAALPLAFVPGANTVAGAALVGGGMGALQPTSSDTTSVLGQPIDSTLLNTGLGTGLGLLGKVGGDKVSNWLTSRAAQPVMGWSQPSVNQAAAQAVGSNASKLDQPALAEASTRLGNIFQAARSPNVSASLSSPTAQAVTSAASSLNKTSRAAFTSSDSVTDLMALLRNGTATARDLGTISSRLGTEAAGEMSSKTGDRALGRALFSLKEHVDDVVGSTITDPALASAYQAARPQYRALLMMEGRPTILNSATGDVNATALGRYLQKADKPGYTRGANNSYLYNAARWGQATGQGKGAPPLNLSGNLGLPWLGYQAANNPASRLAAGLMSRAGAPIAPQIRRGLLGGSFAGTSLMAPELEQ